MNTQNQLQENNNLKVWIDEGMFFAEIKANNVTLDIAKECVSIRLSMVNGKEFPFCIDMRNMHSITKQARDYFASDEGGSLIIASALIVESAVNKIIGNFFLKISRPKVPIRLFTDKQEALTWLRQYVPSF